MVFFGFHTDEICTNLTAVQDEIVNIHNNFRRSVDPPASNMLMMSWSSDVAISAQNWVNNCIMTHGPSSSRMITNSSYEMGENLFKGTKMYAWTDVVSAWHNEVANYLYNYGSINGKATGHYTQVVWYSSYLVGCGVAKCGSNYFYGCQYFRAGNFVGVAPYSEGVPCSACEHACEDDLCTNPCPYINKYINCPALKEEAGCENMYVKEWCPALCQCDNEIVPVGKK
ncbi:cysteine-rich venom protein latisemin [Hoplias malabaricus]|uniref:cysteine-rich venom protein latisemin n=1 Tax=Hoplias malabaricus TaxID=27720 RepID=UPI0034628D3B